MQKVVPQTGIRTVQPWVANVMPDCPHINAPLQQGETLLTNALERGVTKDGSSMSE